MRGGAVWQLVGLITRRSQVQILPPLPKMKRAGPNGAGFFIFDIAVRIWFCVESRFTRSRSDAGASRIAARATEARSAEGKSCPRYQNEKGRPSSEGRLIHFWSIGMRFLSLRGSRFTRRVASVNRRRDQFSRVAPRASPGSATKTRKGPSMRGLLLFSRVGRVGCEQSFSGTRCHSDIPEITPGRWKRICSGDSVYTSELPRRQLPRDTRHPLALAELH